MSRSNGLDEMASVPFMTLCFPFLVIGALSASDRVVFDRVGCSFGDRPELYKIRSDLYSGKKGNHVGYRTGRDHRD